MLFSLTLIVVLLVCSVVALFAALSIVNVVLKD